MLPESLMARSSANLAIFVLSLAGCFISLFLTVKYVQNADIPCTRGSSDCNAVANDAAAWGFGIPGLRAVPTPAMGLLMYMSLAALSMVRVLMPDGPLARRAGILQWSIALAGVAVSGYLTWREAAVIHHWCVWCVGSAAIVFLIFLISSVERMAGAPRAPEGGLEVT
jgi:uncharacterized membrane protein